LSPFQSSLADALKTLESVRVFEQPLAQAAQTVLHCLTSGGKLLLCGNGGSAADSSHIATEFTCRFQEDRRPYPAISLNVDGGLLTAIGNDYAFEDIFARQVRAYGKPGDVLIVLTTSGRSRNVLAALEEAKRQKLKTIAFLGKSGGVTAGVAEIELIVPGENTARIQEAHKFLLHVLCEQVEAGLPRE
jgi:phosphoheptose isomerase